MGLWDNVKNLVVETDKAPPVTAPVPATPVAPVQNVLAGPPTGSSALYTPGYSMPIQTPSTVGQSAPAMMLASGFNQETYEKIMTVLDKNNIDGFDYYEFRQSIQNSSAMPLSEPDKFNTIFAMAKPFGVTKEKLISSIDFYAVKLDEHKAGFSTYIQGLREQEISVREQRKVDNDLAIQQKSDLIRQLTEEINALSQENNALSTEIYSQTSQINAKEQSFLITFDVVLKQINDDKNKIEMYISSEVKQGV